MRNMSICISTLILFARIESNPVEPRVDYYPIISEVQVIDSINWFIEIDISKILPYYLPDVSVPCSTSIFSLCNSIYNFHNEYKTRMYLDEHGLGVITPQNIIGDSIVKIYNVRNGFDLYLRKDTLNAEWEMCIDSLPPDQSLCINGERKPYGYFRYFCYALCSKPSIGKVNVPSDYLCCIKGKIKDVYGKPAPNISINVTTDGPKIYYQTYIDECAMFQSSSESDSAGRFEIKDLIAGYYTVDAYLSMDNMYYHEDSLALINIEPAGSIDTEITLRHYQYLVSNKNLFRGADPKSKTKTAIIEMSDKKALRISFTHAFDIPATYTICIYDMRSRLISEFSRPVMKAGTYSIDWDEKNKKGNNIPPGRYICRISDGANTSTTNFVILK